MKPESDPDSRGPSLAYDWGESEREREKKRGGEGGKESGGLERWDREVKQKKARHTWLGRTVKSKVLATKINIHEYEKSKSQIKCIFRSRWLVIINDGVSRLPTVRSFVKLLKGVSPFCGESSNWISNIVLEMSCTILKKSYNLEGRLHYVQIRFVVM